MHTALKPTGVLTLLLLSLPSLAGDVIEEQREAFKAAYKKVEPNCVADEFLVPFFTSDRTDLTTIRVTSKFGAGRRSYVRGHIHSGLDLIPEKGSPSTVVPVACGTVCSIHLDHPHQTVVIRHKLADGTTLFTSYKHLAEVHVTLGQAVTPDTWLGRMYTKREARKHKGPYDHLHLEVRKRFDDYGVASWTTMTRAALRQRFHDPMGFLRKRLKNSAPKKRPKKRD